MSKQKKIIVFLLTCSGLMLSHSSFATLFEQSGYVSSITADQNDHCSGIFSDPKTRTCGNFWVGDCSVEMMNLIKIAYLDGVEVIFTFDDADDPSNRPLYKIRLKSQ